jgi:rRNA maturation endonuclease Nob1
VREDPEPESPRKATPLGRRSMCPSCGSESVAEILYGMPAGGPALEQSLASGRVVLGGCVVSGGEPDRRCNECGHQWGRERPASRQRKKVRRP